MIGLLLLAMQVASPPPSPYYPAQPIARPLAYAGTCVAPGKDGPELAFAVSATGRGKKRKLAIQSSDARLPSTQAQGFDARQVGPRTIENFRFSVDRQPLVATVSWSNDGEKAWMIIGEPIEVNKPVIYRWFARCTLNYGAPQ